NQVRGVRQSSQKELFNQNRFHVPSLALFAAQRSPLAGFSFGARRCRARIGTEEDSYESRSLRKTVQRNGNGGRHRALVRFPDSQVAGRLQGSRPTRRDGDSAASSRSGSSAGAGLFRGRVGKAWA